MSKINEAIQAGNENFMAAFKRGDAAAVAACYTNDARLLPPNGSMVSGAPDITAFWQGAMNTGIKEARLETKHLEERADLAVEVGQYTLTIQPEGGDAITDVGKYVVVWKDDGGAW
ncbi:MAG: YybH family protein, partial [Blastocatellia bacterium]